MFSLAFRRPFAALICLALSGTLGASSAHAQNRALTTDITNIAAAQNGGRVLSVTSTFENSPTYAATNLIDGQAYNAARPDASRGWASDRFDPIALDAVTLGFTGNRLYTIGKIVLNPATDLTPERWAKDVEVQVSTETAEGPYTPVAQLTLRQKAEAQEFPILPVEARFVRLAFRSNYGSDRAVALGEVEIYEAIGNQEPIGAVINRLDTALAELRQYKQDAARNGTPVAPSAVRPTGLQTSEAPGRVNIAAAKNGGKVVAYSTLYANDPLFGPDKLIDGEVFRMADGTGSFGWASEGFAPGREFVTLSFGGDVHLIGKIIANPVSNNSELRWARRIEVQATTGDSKAGPWKTVANLNLKTQATNQEFEFRPVEARYIRLVFQANGPGVVLPGADPNVNSDRAVSLGEVEVYEAPSQDDQLDAIIGKFNNVLADLKTLRRRDVDETRTATR